VLSQLYTSVRGNSNNFLTIYKQTKIKIFIYHCNLKEVIMLPK